MGTHVGMTHIHELISIIDRFVRAQVRAHRHQPAQIQTILKLDRQHDEVDTDDELPDLV